MNKSRFTRVMESPLLTIFMVLAVSALGFAWYQAEAAQRAPGIAGYDWGKHADVLMIVVPSEGSDCDSCGASSIVEEMAKIGIARHLDVLVIASDAHPEVKKLKKSQLSQSRLSIVTNAHPNLIKRFISQDGIAAVRIENGRVVKQAEGNFEPEKFLMEGGEA